MQLRCGKCREALNGEVIFCPFCGAPQNGASTPSATPPPIPQASATAAKPPPIPVTAASSAPFTISVEPEAVTAIKAVPPPLPPPLPPAPPVPPPLPVREPTIAHSPSQAPVPARTPAPPPAPAAAPPPQKKRSGCLGCAGFIVLALAIAGIAAYFYITNWLKQNELAGLNREAIAHIAAGDIVSADAAIQKIRTLDGKSAFISANTAKIAATKRDAVEAIKKSQTALRDRDLAAARDTLLKAAKLDRTNALLVTQDTAINAKEKLRDQALEAMRKCLSVNDFACGKTQAGNATRIDKSFDAVAEFTKAEVAYRDAQNNPIQSGVTSFLEAAATALVRAATEPSPSTPSPANTPSASPKAPRTGGSALPDCDQLLLQSKNAQQNRRHDEAVQTAEAALNFSPACAGAQEQLDAALTARRRAKQLAR